MVTIKNNHRQFRRTLTILKFLFGISLLLGLFIWKDNGRKILHLFLNFQYQYLVMLFCMGTILIWVSCLKWNLVLKEHSINISILRLMGLYCIGQYFNNFLPSMIGGDVARSYLLGRQIKSQSRSLASVFLERFTGLVALVLFAIAFSLINFDLLLQPIIAFSLGFVIIAAAIFIILLFFAAKPIDALSNRLKGKSIATKLFLKLNHVFGEITFFKTRYKLLSKLMSYSLIFHFLTSVNVYFVCLSINFRPSFLDIAVLTPIILLITSIPISPNNLGLWEWAFGFFLVEAGAALPEGIAVALTLRAIGLVQSIIGGVLLLFEKADTSNLNETLGHHD